ncbi:MAG: hypothetical protein A2V88_04895 [Elusimicrobia bacterium RBG_16_66_12]|nr:MAG: hypothetical protein A2V88_04895 [Elusimicrobia bacterium RBG_16_66_12]
MCKIRRAEWNHDAGLRTGAEVLARGLRTQTLLVYEPDPGGRHKMKWIRYALYRTILVALRAWSGPAQWLDTHYWINVDPDGMGLGAAVGMRLLRAEADLIVLLKGICVHKWPDRLAAAHFNCPLCLPREAEHLRKAIEILDVRLRDE